MTTTMKGLTKIVDGIDAPMERIYKLKPEWRPKTENMHQNERAFNYDAVDEDYNNLVNK